MIISDQLIKKIDKALETAKIYMNPGDYSNVEVQEAGKELMRGKNHYFQSIQQEIADELAEMHKLFGEIKDETENLPEVDDRDIRNPWTGKEEEPDTQCCGGCDNELWLNVNEEFMEEQELYAKRKAIVRTAEYHDIMEDIEDLALDDAELERVLKRILYFCTDINFSVGTE